MIQFFDFKAINVLLLILFYIFAGYTKQRAKSTSKDGNTYYCKESRCTSKSIFEYGKIRNYPPDNCKY